MNMNLHPKRSEYIIEVEVDKQTIRLWAVKKNVKERTDYNKCEMVAFYVGDHMIKDLNFSGENHEVLRKMIGDFIAQCIREATESGYRMAQADIKSAIGL